MKIVKTIILDEEDFKKLEKVMEKNAQKFSPLVRAWIKDYITEKKIDPMILEDTTV